MAKPIITIAVLFLHLIFYQIRSMLVKEESMNGETTEQIPILKKNPETI